MRHILFISSILATNLIFVGCSKKDTNGEGSGHHAEGAHKEEGHDHGSSGSGASFQEGKGITLIDESKKSIGLELAEVAEQPLDSTASLTAQVYRTASETSGKYSQERSGYAYATALVSREVAAQLKRGQKFTYHPKQAADTKQKGELWKVDEALLPTLGKAEALLELQDTERSLPVGAFIEAQVPLGIGSKKVLCIPRSAVLQTSTGNFAYVQNGEFLFRTEIKTGSENSDYVEVLEGLYEGDTIAVKPVEALYLIELRATKGGGHSH